MTRFKKSILFIHRWLGFISGLVVVIVSLTGCIFCFQDEIQDAIHSYRKIEVSQQPYLEPTAIKSIALQQYPQATINYLYYFAKDRPAMAIVNQGKTGFTYVYINPYSGKILHTEDPQSNFFTVVEYIHLYLLLPPKIGQTAVGISVLIFLALMITGIILWWPKRKNDRKRSFTIKWNGRWRRVNYDLHNVLGFYATSIAVILAITGLSIAFEWVNNSIYNAGNLGKTYESEKTIPKSDTTVSSVGRPTLDIAFATTQAQSPQAEMFLLYEPAEKTGTIDITAYDQTLHYYRSDLYSFDRYSGKLLKYLPQSRKSPGMKLNTMNYDIHVGQIWGLPGKILAFITSLICASLPVTGFIVWLGKRKKSKKKITREVAHRKSHARLQLN